jgi:GntR family transcriptional repressor for pyruvate dehydrogenase complex
MTSDELTCLVEKAIRDGKYKSGGKVPGENELARQHGVSRTMVREAYARLTGRGILVKRKSFGTFVV